MSYIIIFYYLINFFLVGAQQLLLGPFVYLLPFTLSLNLFYLKIKDKYLLIILIFTLIGILTLLIKGYPIIYIIKIIQFFLGSLILYILLIGIRLIKRRYIIISFLNWCIIEKLYFFLFDKFPRYLESYFSNIQNIEIRSELSSSISRFVGPTLNTSITGTFLAVIFFMATFEKESIFIEDNNLSFKSKTKITNLIAILSFSLLILSFSGTGFISFLILLLIKSYNFIFGVFKTLKIKKLIFYLFILSLILIFIQLRFKIIDADLLYRYSSGYISFIFQDKIDKIDWYFKNSTDFLFGIDFKEFSIYKLENIGGDILIFSFIRIFGFFYFITFWILCMVLSKGLRIYNVVLLLSTLHYGTIFTLTGQLLFSSLIISNKYYLENRKKYFNSKPHKL